MHKPWFNFGGPLLIEQGLSPERRSHDLAVTVLYAPYSLDIGNVQFMRRWHRGVGVDRQETTEGPSRRFVSPKRMFFELFADTGAKKRGPELAGSLIKVFQARSWSP